MNKLIKLFLILIGVTATILWFSLPSGDDPDAINSTAVNAMFIIMYFLLTTAILATLVFGSIKWLTKPRNRKRALLAISIFSVVIAIAYGFSSNNEAVVNTMAQRGVMTTESTVKIIGTGLNVFFTLAIVAILLMVLPSVKKLFVK